MSKMNLTSMYNWFTHDKVTTSIKQLSDNQILSIANDINGLFSETNLVESKPDISLPRLVVVGTQSSGKSSVLNNIMAMDILPTGKNMVTRTPITVCLHKINTPEAWIEFGSYINTEWIIEKKINLTLPIPLTTETEQIKDYIKTKTTQLAGNNMNISHKSIELRLYSNNVPNISFIDLPGIIMVACTDKGQPENITNQIETLLTSHVKHPKSIVLLIMQSRTDLETDLGMALIKKCMNNKTIGILTKPDLLNSDSHIGEYLLGNISKNLMLDYGYHVIKNRNDQESKDIDIIKSFELEKKYFENHHEYKKQNYNGKVGYESLINGITSILIKEIRKDISNVMFELIKLEGEINKKIILFGPKTPSTKEEKMTELNLYVISFIKCIDECIESKGIEPNIGKNIKKNFDDFRIAIDKMHPFKNQPTIYNEKYFNNLITSFEGYHMSNSISIVELIEKCMSDTINKPIMLLKNICIECLRSIMLLLTDSIIQISKKDQFSKYSQLADALISEINNSFTNKHMLKSEKKINELFKLESNYIWTDSPKFLINLKKTTIDNMKHDVIIELLELYYDTIKDTIRNIVPKYIMSSLIRTLQTDIMNYISIKFIKDDKLIYIKEDPEVEKQRIYYNSMNNKIKLIKEVLNK